MIEWWSILLFFFISFSILIFIGVPVSFSFLFINVIGSFIFMGGVQGVKQLSLSIYSALSNFTITPIPLFILMGEIIFQSGIAFKALNVIDKFFGKIPGRLSILSVAASTFFSGLTGSAISNTALLGSILIPEMKKKGYGKPFIIGPIIGSGGLAMMIPPSALAVVLGSVAHISVAGILVGSILPGLIMASLYTLYIITRALIQPSLAPAYESQKHSKTTILKEFFLFVLPLFSVVILVIAPIYFGAATPTECAALGCLGSLVLSAFYKKLNLAILKKSLEVTTKISCMIFLIIAGSVGFGQIISFTGAGNGMTLFMSSLSISKTTLIILTIIIMLILGCFMDQIAMMMITLPLFMPLIHQYQINPVWFGIIMLIAMDIGFTSPPFGLLLFVFKGIAPDDISMPDIYKAAIPFILCNLITIILILVFPNIVIYVTDTIKH
ncbi:MAG TPA: TRAP transporter large permease subunit [Syntrophorhabdaceae bacterium]|jgi:tripartite ATP-independent transporter DctM subunit|nr:TRAP transporter large permease subunit [Syntrophorhabdaceae bacterium]MDI9560902.1 TRAP transporter large permease subunit [Pseudomonadota bacterium]MBP8697824.1 TRAP transporter large permease subunit [Syntrophorhabdaceae bacterium]MBV6505796.1 C4-dicarboxylate TRAP transporter large permease protein DctM [Syntrophorhabdaceae bacterium]HNZ58314.1 TRAP transporter large permease subunit [Syntrophorhabdaceae bacterium]